VLDHSAKRLANKSFGVDQRLPYPLRIGIIGGCAVISWGVIILAGFGVLQLFGH
jgi:hypothetical protein